MSDPRRPGRTGARPGCEAACELEDVTFRYEGAGAAGARGREPARSSPARTWRAGGPERRRQAARWRRWCCACTIPRRASVTPRRPTTSVSAARHGVRGAMTLRPHAGDARAAGTVRGRTWRSAAPRRAAGGDPTRRRSGGGGRRDAPRRSRGLGHDASTQRGRDGCRAGSASAWRSPGRCVRDAPVLILDEPMTGLDERARRRRSSRCAADARARGAGELARPLRRAMLTDRRLDAGRVVETGTTTS